MPALLFMVDDPMDEGAVRVRSMWLAAAGMADEMTDCNSEAGSVECFMPNRSGCCRYRRLNSPGCTSRSRLSN